jgi:outer membrane protein assembly factor BamB
MTIKRVGWNLRPALLHPCVLAIGLLIVGAPVTLGQPRLAQFGVRRGFNPQAQKAQQEKLAADAKQKAVEQALPPEVRPIIKPFLAKLFNPKPLKAGDPLVVDGEENERDYMDSRAPHDLKVEQMMRAADVAIQRNEWKVAQELLQRLLDLPEDSLHRLPDGRWQSVRRSANQLLGSAPKQFLDDYRTQYSGLAQQLLNEAKRSGNTADYVMVASRFLQTPAGAEAANYLGSLHFDRGEFGLAATWFDDIARSSAALSMDSAWRVKAALANRRAGDLSASQKLIEGFEKSPGQRVTLGVGGVNPGAWLGGVNAALPTRSLVLNDWKQLYGSVSRQGTSTGSEPLLSPVWNVPLTSSHTVRRRVNWILQDLLDQDRTPIVAASPLVVGGRVVYRDLRGVRSVDIETGKTLWESLEGVSAERILGGLPAPQSDGRDAFRGRGMFQNDFNEYQGQSVEYHPLASLMFRDGTYGTLSSDGRQVFVIEDLGILSRNQPGQQWGWDGSGEMQDPYGVSWKTNRLVSYDLNTGRPRWSVGGPDAQESFDLPLAGSFFYGVPAVDGEELLVIAGKGDDVRLWSLDRATGVPRWSQLIAYTDTKIEQDIGRRWFTAQVAADGGVIVCPTTVGWLVAVDRMRQSVLWAHRYLPPSGSGERDPNTQFVPQRDLNSQWSPAAPIISGSVVVYTPPEEPIVLALNLLDGRRLWEKPKEAGMYLAGVFADRVVLVSRSDIAAFNLSTGKQLWTLPLGEAHPSGRGQAVGDQYYLPLSDGELRIVDLKSGKEVSRSYVPMTHPPLGNLAMHRGKLVALGPQGLVGFGQRDAVTAEIQRRKLQNPDDAWAMLREAEVYLLNRDHAAALPLLLKDNSEGLSEDELSRRHAEAIECLASVIRQDPKSHESELEALGRLAQTDSEKRLHQELTADHLAAQSKFLEAFEVLWSLREGADVDALVTRSDNPQVSMSPKVWLASRLSELWSAAAGKDREDVDRRIAEIIASASSANDSSRQLSATLLRFHPAATVLQEALIEGLAKREDFAGAQFELMKIAAGSDRTAAARATERLARLMEQFQQPADAAYYYQLLDSEFGEVSLSEGVMGADLVKRLKSEGKISAITKSRGAAWDERPLELVQGPVQYMPPAQEIASRTVLPYFEPLMVEVQLQEQRLAFEQLANGQYSWLVPLRSSPRNQGDGYAATAFLGHQIALINRDMLHVVSPIEKRLLWTKALDDSGEGGPFWRHASRPPTPPMVTASRNPEQIGLLQQAGFTGRLAVAEPNYIAVFGRRSISILDPRTGERLWRKEGIPQFAQVVGNRDMVCVVPQNRTQAEAYRASDGKALKIDDLGTMLGNAIQMRGDSILLLEAGSSTRFWSLTAPKTVLRLHQPLSGEDRWKVEFPPNALVTQLDENELLVVPRDGKAERIDVASGKRTALEPIVADDMKGRRIESYGLTDDDRIYFVANVMDSTGFHHYGESLPSVRANGIIIAWNRSDGKIAWRQEVKNQNLVVDRFRSVPVMLFVTRSWQQKGNVSFGTLSVQAIHKQTGKILHNSTSPSMYSGFHSLDVNLSEPSIELKSYNLRMRLVPTNGPVAEAKPADAAEPTKNH